MDGQDQPSRTPCDCQPHESDVYDVVIVGAGPCGLAVAARLHESTPAAIFTDEEHRRFHWIQRHGRKMTLKNCKNGRVSLAATRYQRPEYKMAVLDANHNEWMGRWNRLFTAYQIPHLRSHMLWHVDPHDRDSLLAQAVRQGREAELTELKGCVGKEISKHAKKKKARYIGSKQEAHVDINERDRKDYFNPSQALFCDHSNDVVDRYNLRDGLIFKECLRDIDYGVVNGISEEGDSLFTVTTDKGRLHARAVVLAVGPANDAQIPHVPGMTRVSTKTTDGQQRCAFPQACHSMHISTFPDAVVRERMAAGQQTNILVVGGGLTSAQLADLAIRRGVSRVWHIMRGPLRVKHFDVDLAWMGKFRNTEQARFWLADSDEERLAMLREARGGGSITPLFYKRVKQHVASGRLVLREKTVLAEARFDAKARQGSKGGGAWVVKAEPPLEGLPAMDYIYFATGIQTDFKALGYLQTMMERHPIEGFGGFPCLNDDLMWNDGVPLFFAGRLAALRLGPAAPNLGGARLGAERIAWALENTIAKSRGVDENLSLHGEDGDKVIGYCAGRGSKYSSLSEE